MDAGLAVVLAAIGFFVLVPLWFAWLSTDSRRWGRVERVLGREPSGDPNDRWKVGAGLSALSLLTAAVLLLDRRQSGHAAWPALIWLVSGLLYAVSSGILYRRQRRDRWRAGSGGAQVEGGPEAGGPGAGGVGRH